MWAPIQESSLRWDGLLVPHRAMAKVPCLGIEVKAKAEDEK